MSSEQIRREHNLKTKNL